ncbi:PIG-L deacetylase family protein [Rhodococcus xishaensis]|uniref:PIG-L family deacetylase n=1 Tax=Rhodococcus xishaensis TaxID=2487364 RepID=A0A438AZF5_9NOCA|nr:PIG-L deacetylase family protein [Rhodococcus xishaensis]RVW04042.1 PIG-L family deacetylase [Rhodococcus xishaensis]
MDGTTGNLRLREVASRGPVLAVVAHPDDESFGLGAILASLASEGAEVRVLCLTRGEASTLGAAVDLAQVRRGELVAAADLLGVRDVVLLDHPDGGLNEVDPAILDAAVLDVLGAAATLVVFEVNGVTGHPDHRAATAAAFRVAADQGLNVVEWGVAPTVADSLNAELGTEFAGLDGEGAVDVDVDRKVQSEAIACHESQATDNPVLLRRLELSGSVDRIRIRRA